MEHGHVQAVGRGNTRREFLRRTAGVTLGALVGPGLLVACGGDEEAATPAAATGTSPAQGAEGTLGGTLNLFVYEGYEMVNADNPAAKDWQQSNGVDLKVDFIGTPADVLPKLKSPGSGGLDVSTQNQAWLQELVDADLMTPLTAADVPSLDKLFPFFSENHLFRNSDDTWKAVPFNWGPLALSYRVDLMPEPKSYLDLLDPSLKGRVVLKDDAIGNAQLASIALGYNPDALAQDEFAEVKDFLKNLHAQATTLASSDGDAFSLLGSGDGWVVFIGWFFADLSYPKVKTVIPKEGAWGYCDSVFIPTTVDNRATAAAFCELYISGNTAANSINHTSGATTNPDVVPLLDERTRALVPYDDIAGYFEDVYLTQGNFATEDFVTADDVVNAWESIKAG